MNRDFNEKALTPDMYSSETEVIDASSVNGGINMTAGSNTTMTLIGGAGNDKLYADTSTEAVPAYLSGEAGNDLLTGGEGADTLVGGVGTDTLEGKGGSDTFVYVAGNDIIKDYTYGEEEQDVIVVSDAYVSSSTVNGKDVVLNIRKEDATKDSGTITVKNAKNATLSVVDTKGTDTRIFGYYGYGEETTTIVLNSTFKEKSLTTDMYSADVLNIDASGVSGGLIVEGNDKDNSIKGGAGNDKLYGNAGSDVLEGGAGNDVLSGGEGNGGDNDG